MDIKQIIIEILASNNYVSLPGVGSVIQKYQPAKLSSDGKTFEPPRQEIAFDTTRTFDDEAIEKHLVESKGINPSEAKAIVSKFILSLKSDLDSGNEVSLRGIGTLKKNNKSNIILIPFTSEEQATETLGLKNVSVEPKQNIKKPSNQAKSNTKKTNRSILVIFILLLLVGLFALAAYLLPPLRFWEGDLFAKTTKPKTESSAPIDIKKEPTENDAQMPLTDSMNNVEPIKESSPIQQDANAEVKFYYIIIGSFNSMENAQRFAKKVEAAGIAPEIIEGKGNYRVSRGKFADRKEALKELGRLRHGNPKESAWLLVQ